MQRCRCAVSGIAGVEHQSSKCGQSRWWRTQGHPVADEVGKRHIIAMGGLCNRRDDRVGLGVSFASVAAANLPRDDGAAELLLRQVVRRGNAGVVQAREQLVAVSQQVVAQFPVLRMRDVTREQPIRPALDAARILVHRRGCQLAVPVRECDRVLEQDLDCAREANSAARLLGLQLAGAAQWMAQALRA